MTLRYFMMKIRNFVFGIALICAICFTSCSDGSSSSESNDTSSRVLDLRIKKNGVVHNSSRSIENAAEITQTAHVKATAVSGGIQFESKLPPAEPVALIRHKWPATNCGKPRSSAFHLSF